MRLPTPRNMSYFIWVLLALLALGQPAVKAPGLAASEVLGAHAQADDQALRGKVYVAIGDSISAGRFATTSGQIFPSLVAQHLGMTLQLVARSGARAAWALPQLAIVDQAHPALVTIELGTNDVGFNTPLDQFSAQYETIVNAVSLPGTRVLCIGSWLPSEAIDARIADICRQHGGTFISLSGFYAVDAFHASDGGVSYLGRADWFHPGDEGHAAIAAAVESGLQSPPSPSAEAPQVPQPQPPAASDGPSVLRITPR